MSDIKREMSVYLSSNLICIKFYRGMNTILAKMYFFVRFLYKLCFKDVSRYIENKYLTWQQPCLHIKKCEFCILLIPLQLTIKFDMLCFDQNCDHVPF